MKTTAESTINVEKISASIANFILASLEAQTYIIMDQEKSDKRIVFYSQGSMPKGAITLRIDSRGLFTGELLMSSNEINKEGGNL